MLRAVAKHSASLAQAVVDAGALEGLVLCLEEFDPSVKEAAAWALGNVATHSPSLAQAVTDAGAAPLLVLCLQEPEVPLKRVIATTLSDIAKHSAELAQAVVDAGAVPLLSPLLAHADSKMKRCAAEALAAVAGHSVDLAEVVVEAETFPRVLSVLKDVEQPTRTSAARLVREVAKHSSELAKLVVNAGGAAALTDFTRDARGSSRLPGLMALGFIAAFSETLALAVVLAKGLPVLKDAALTEPEDHVKAAAVWAVGQIGRHTPEHAKAVTDAGLLAPLVVLLTSPSGNDDLHVKAKRALKAVVAKCHDPAALSPLLRESDARVQRYALCQLALLLPRDAVARRAYMTGGYLQRTQEIKAAPALVSASTGSHSGVVGSDEGSDSGAGAMPRPSASPQQCQLKPKAIDAIARINSAFPEEAVK